jgi:hypothetical protein
LVLDAVARPGFTDKQDAFMALNEFVLRNLVSVTAGA